MPKEPQETIIQDFIGCYLSVIAPQDTVKGKENIETWLRLVKEQMEAPYQFEVFHQAIRLPFDYYRFGLDFIRPLVDFDRSRLLGSSYLDAISDQITQGDNVILLANHQIEPDPQIISLLIEKNYPKLAEQMIFAAGHRVTTDPLAVPMSLGRNLLCIFSKKYMDYPPEKKGEKIQHNQRTMKKMQELLSQGGKCIYVAPSGGRDRPNEEGIVEVAPFDPDSLELFRLISRKSGVKTHFYPLALKTFELMPPQNERTRKWGRSARSISVRSLYRWVRKLTWIIFRDAQDWKRVSCAPSVRIISVN